MVASAYLILTYLFTYNATNTLEAWNNDDNVNINYQTHRLLTMYLGLTLSKEMSPFTKQNKESHVRLTDLCMLTFLKNSSFLVNLRSV